ncbi:hypothetical protein ACI2S5_25930 [Ralstonia nicotianae]|uniref:hypothetical protein n=1 Tax=Ralstonia pseudosolanacearum TaxID=1310165 RepID=UPI00156F3B36|nr:hypothetical protein HI816_08080 [Ralstonia solanacearum]QKM23085.1 hypothetical protein HI796_08075 [Ralstonia solanacearum]QKM27893.1 hypothetical protein HI795_08080 [Ralstonia solanacearum]UZF18569.1 hypothetical protein LG939_10540 [Ralstonia solanacearum]
MTAACITNFNGFVPDWLLPLHRARESGLMPRGGWVVIQAGGRVGKWVPALPVTLGYKPSRRDNFSSLRGLDCELLLDDETSCSIARGLINGILGANPRRFWALTCGQRNNLILLKKAGGAHGIQ